jgi:hypothetical protein
LLSVSRGDLVLRPEIVALLGLAGLSDHLLGESGAGSPLLYYDDPRLLKALAEDPGLRVTLLDHNALASKVYFR